MKEKLKKLSETERGKAAIKLSGYMIFLLLVIVLILISGAGQNTYTEEESKESQSQSTEENTHETTYLDMQKMLYEGTYKFTYNISGLVNANFEGEKQENKIIGYKETASETIKYEIEDDKVYKVNLNSRTEYTDLYKDLDSELFNFKSLFEKINSKSSTIKKDDIQKEYSYNDIDGYDYKVLIKEQVITNITVTTKDLIYSLEFSY